MVAQRCHLLTRMSSCKSPRAKDLYICYLELYILGGTTTLTCRNANNFQIGGVEILVEIPMYDENIYWEGQSNKKYLTETEDGSRGQMRLQG